MSDPAPTPPIATTSSSKRKPRVSLAIATAFGVGYLPKAPGTWGSIFGAAISMGLHWINWRRTRPYMDLVPAARFWTVGLLSGGFDWAIVLLVAIVGLFTASRAARYVSVKDPQFIVIDEVSGQMIAYFSPFTLLNWKSFLLGFILFRAFDIWKPFPARQAESLPGGLGIMADDWMAGIYAALGLWIFRSIGF